MFRLRPFLLSVFCLALVFASIPAQAGRVRGTAVKVTFTDLPTDKVVSDNLPGSDGSTAYINGVEAVTASFDTTGLTIKLGRARPAEYTRHIHYNFASTATFGADGSECTSWTPPATAWGPELSTVYASPIGVTFDAMAVGQVADAKVHFDTAEGNASDWLIRFDTSLYPASSYATVTRVSATKWTISADGSDVAVLVEPPTRQLPDGVMHGYFYLPFSFDVDTNLAP
jgi:hypothetical protein